MELIFISSLWKLWMTFPHLLKWTDVVRLFRNYTRQENITIFKNPSHQQISFNEVLACVWVTIFFDNFACVCKQWLLNWWSSKHYQVEIFVTENLLLKLWHIIENGIPDYSSFTIVLLLLILHWELNKTNLYQSLTFHLLLTYYHHFFTCILARAFVQTGESVLQLFASEVCSYVLSLPK